MKKKLLLTFLWLTLCGTLLNAQTLDGAIINAAVRISQDLPAGSSAVVIDFISDSNDLNAYVINQLYGAILRNRRVTSVRLNQEQLRNIREALSYNEAGELIVESAQNIGQILGVQYLVTGSLKLVGSEYRIAFNAVNTNAELQSQYTATLNPRNDTRLASFLGINTPAASSVSRQETEAQREQRMAEEAKRAQERAEAEARREQRRQKRAEIPESAKRLNTVGVSIGTWFVDPLFILTVRGTYSPVRNIFLEAGLDLGLGSTYEDVEVYYSLYPYAHVGYFVPFVGRGGWYAGIGASFMTGQYKFFYGEAQVNVFAFDLITGFNIMNFLDISYTFRIGGFDSSLCGGKLSIGYVYRFN